MKNIFKKELFKKKYKLRIYVYLLLLFFVTIFISIIYISHQNRWIINSTKYYNWISTHPNFKQQDFLTDSSITKFVNNIVHFNKLSYSPNDLVYVSSNYIYDTKWNSRLRNEANDALQIMAKDFYDYFWVKMIVVSAYRSYDYQVWIKSRGCSDLLCAKAWYSEHQTWLAVDLWETTTKNEFLSKSDLVIYFNRLNKNAHKYWFHNTYQKWLSIDWYLVEPWHWRYLWTELAKKLYENRYTFAEYYNNNN